MIWFSFQEQNQKILRRRFPACPLWLIAVGIYSGIFYPNKRFVGHFSIRTRHRLNFLFENLFKLVRSTTITSEDKKILHAPMLHNRKILWVICVFKRLSSAIGKRIELTKVFVCHVSRLVGSFSLGSCFLRIYEYSSIRQSLSDQFILRRCIPAPFGSVVIRSKLIKNLNAHSISNSVEWNAGNCFCCLQSRPR